MRFSTDRVLRPRTSRVRRSNEHRPVTSVVRGLCGGSRVRPFLAAGAATMLAGLAICGGEICVAVADGGDSAQLTEDLGRDGAPVWSPDGTRIAITSARDA